MVMQPNLNQVKEHTSSIGGARRAMTGIGPDGARKVDVVKKWMCTPHVAPDVETQYAETIAEIGVEKGAKTKIVEAAIAAENDTHTM